jgi:hypothetical protein
MVTKKKKTPKKTPATLKKKVTADAKALLIAHSSAEDGLEKDIFTCLVLAFAAAGLNSIDSPADTIVWSTIAPDSVVVQLGDDTRVCLRNKGHDCPDLAGLFLILKEKKRVTTVAQLVAAIAAIIGGGL